MTILKIDPLNDGISELSLVDKMGNDLSIVNAARASFNNESNTLTEKDVKLIKYLIKHEHWSPFRSVTFTIKWKAPLFVCRQIWKHVVASAHIEDQVMHNEVSFRYMQMPEEFYIPKQFRMQSKSNKQCSDGYLDDDANSQAQRHYLTQMHNSYRTYEDLLDLGVSRELARNVLPPAIYTSWVNVISLQALLNMVTLRLGKGAQNESQAYAKGLEEIIKVVVPHTYKIYKETKLND